MSTGETPCRAGMDPELAAALAAVPPERQLSALFDFDDLPATRRRLDERRTGTGGVGGDPDVVTEVLSVPTGEGTPDVALRLHRPAAQDRPLPALYWVHGGGMVSGTAESADPLLRSFVAEVECVAVAVEYRLAPEHPFPAPVDDTVAGLRWLGEHCAELGVDPERLAIGGRSAGGGLAAATALLVRDRGGPRLSFQMLLAPMLDHRNASRSSRQITDIGMWDRSMNVRGWQLFLGSLTDGDVPAHASPSLAEDLGGLPPAFIDVGALEVFRDEAIDYATRLAAAGGAVELHVWPGAYHGFESMAPHALVSRAATRTRSDALRRALHPAQRPSPSAPGRDSRMAGLL